MRKRMLVMLATRIVCLISGITLAVMHAVAPIFPALLTAVGASFIAVTISTRGGAAIRDEMVKRADVLSGYYTCSTTLYFIFTCAIINFFRPLPLSISGLLLTMMIFMSFTFIAIRFLLLKRGVPE